MKASFENIIKINASYPIGYIDNFIEQSLCQKLCNEINSFHKYDDVVMNGRMRVNKGSSNFKNYLKQYPNLNLIYKLFNKKENYILLKKKLDLIKPEISWNAQINNFYYSKSNFGEQSFDLIKYMRRSPLISIFFKKTINLDIDFSKSKKGYFREAHRDRDSRIISFLLYLNTINKNLGGEFEIYNLKKNFKKEKLDRFPSSEKVELIKKFAPKSGQLFIFLSTPDSYHGVSKFISDKQDRIFVYGSYSLDRKVKWKID